MLQKEESTEGRFGDKGDDIDLRLITDKLLSVAAAAVAGEGKEGEQTMDDEFDIRDGRADLGCVLVL